jgi:hypothetical protein
LEGAVEVFGVSGTNNAIMERMHDAVKTARQTLSSFDNVKIECEGFASGEFFKPIFFLIGANYIFFITAGGFQSLLGSRFTFCLIALLSLVTLTYFFWFWHLLSKQARGNEERKHIPLRSTYTVLRWYAVAIALSIVATIFLVRLSDPMHKCMLNGLDMYCVVNYNYSFCMYVRVVMAIFALSISILPYIIYNFRQKLFLAHCLKRLHARGHELKTAMNNLDLVKEIVSHK